MGSDEALLHLNACPNCGQTTPKWGGALGVYRCACGKKYCDRCSGGGLIDLPRCPVSPYHEDLQKCATVSVSGGSSPSPAPAATTTTAAAPASKSTCLRCERCSRDTEHSRTYDQYAGELWLCAACGYKTMRDESMEHSKLTVEQAESPFEQQYREDMKDTRFSKMLQYMSFRTVTVDISGRFTAAQSNRICAIVLRNFTKPDQATANEVQRAGFDLSWSNRSPAGYVADIKRVCVEKYREVYGASAVQRDETAEAAPAGQAKGQRGVPAQSDAEARRRSATRSARRGSRGLWFLGIVVVGALAWGAWALFGTRAPGETGPRFGQSFNVIEGVNGGSYLLHGYTDYLDNKPGAFSPGAVLVVGMKEGVHLGEQDFGYGSVVVIEGTASSPTFRRAGPADNVVLSHDATVLGERHGAGRLSIPIGGNLGPSVR